MIAWVYGSGFPKSLNIWKAVDKLQGNEREEFIDEDFIKRNPKDNNDGVFESGLKDGLDGAKRTKGTSEWEWWGTALKPALEPITVARKPLDEKTVAENCLKWGVGGINIDESRVGTDEIQTNHYNTIGDMTSFHQSQAGNNYDISKHIGRFPANLIHDGSDEVVELFPNTKSGAVKQFTNNGANQPINLGGGMLKPTEGSEGSASRFFYCAKASKSERNKGCEELEEKRKKVAVIQTPWVSNDWEWEDWKQLSSPMKNHHPTVKPIALMEYLVKMVSREWALVLDPFAWSGSTLLACKNLGRGYVGIEMDEEYIKIINARLWNTPKNI